MIAFFKGKAVQQVDSFLCEGKFYSAADISKLIRENRTIPIKRKKGLKNGNTNR